MKRKYIMNTRTFIALARDMHGNKYKYSKTRYDRSYIQVCVTCNKHGDYYTLPTAHLRGAMCKKCHHTSVIKKVLAYYRI